MNEKVMRHKELCDGLNTLYARKNHDYGDSFHQTFVEEGLAMARIRLGTNSPALRPCPVFLQLTAISSRLRTSPSGTLSSTSQTTLS